MNNEANDKILSEYMARWKEAVTKENLLPRGPLMGSDKIDEIMSKRDPVFTWVERDHGIPAGIILPRESRGPLEDPKAIMRTIGPHCPRMFRWLKYMDALTPGHSVYKRKDLVRDIWEEPKIPVIHTGVSPLKNGTVTRGRDQPWFPLETNKLKPIVMAKARRVRAHMAGRVTLT